MIALLALVPFALAACDRDDEVSADTGAAGTTEASAPNSDDEGGDAGDTVKISADPTGGLTFEEDSLETREPKSGSVTISFTNDSSVPHDVRVEGPEGDLGGTEVITGDSAEATVGLGPGEYTFYCSVAGHREAGMEGTLLVCTSRCG